MALLQQLPGLSVGPRLAGERTRPQQLRLERPRRRRRRNDRHPTRELGCEVPVETPLPTFLPGLWLLSPAPAVLRPQEVLRQVPRGRDRAAALSRERPRRRAEVRAHGARSRRPRGSHGDGAVEARRGGLSGVHQLRRCERGARSEGTRRRAARREHDHRPVDRPRLAARREEPMAQVHALGALLPRADHLRRPRDRGEGRILRPDCRAARHLPHPGGSRRAPRARGARRREPAATARESRNGVGSSCDHLRRAGQKLDPHPAVALHDLSRR